MFIDTCLLAVVLFSLRRWKPWAALPLLALFFAVDIAYFGANLAKVPDGGWLPPSDRDHRLHVPHNVGDRQEAFDSSDAAR